MTEQEAEAWAARLTRIWGTVTPLIPLDNNTCGGFIVFSLLLEVRVIYSGLLFKMFDYTAKSADYFELTARSDGFMYFIDRPLCEPYLPLFRRGCWLSGCPIESSAHEKSEWVQGFSREELEGWNLKM